MATTIITKFGNGTPEAEDLQHGELAIDMLNNVLYSKNGSGTVIQVGGGDVDWNNIINLPDEIINIIDPDNAGDSYIDLAALKALAEQNATDISKLQTDLGALTTRVSTNETNIGNNSDRLDALEAVTGVDDGLQAQINQLRDDLETLDDQINGDSGLAEQVGTNTDDIADLKDLLDANLNGLIFGGEYNADVNIVENATDAGKAAGLTDGQNVPSSSADTKGIYLIITTAGELSGTTRADGDQANVGDWLVSDGIHGWLHLEIGQGDVTFSMIQGEPEDNTKLKASLDAKLNKDGDTIDCGRYGD